MPVAAEGLPGGKPVAVVVAHLRKRCRCRNDDDAVLLERSCGPQHAAGFDDQRRSGNAFRPEDLRRIHRVFMGIVGARLHPDHVGRHSFGLEDAPHRLGMRTVRPSTAGDQNRNRLPVSKEDRARVAHGDRYRRQDRSTGRPGIGALTVPDSTTIASAGSCGTRSLLKSCSSGQASTHAQALVERRVMPVSDSSCNHGRRCPCCHVRTIPRKPSRRRSGRAGSM